MDFMIIRRLLNDVEGAGILDCSLSNVCASDNVQ